MIKTQVVKLKVNKTMRKHLDNLCDYRRYCWNKGLETWQLMYEAHTLNKQDNPSPNERRVRDELVANKSYWQYNLSARCLQLAIKDLANAWKNFFDKAQPDWGIPSFKSKKASRQGFKTDRAKIVNGKLRLDKPRSISKEGWFDLKSYEALKMDEVKVVSIFKEKDGYYAALPYEEEISAKTNIQNDLLQKFTTDLVDDYDQIVIEDLAVKEMMMTHVASKGMQRSLFSKFRQILTYKCDWYSKELILADKTYPSTQRCAEYDYVKKGDEKITLQGNKKHGTKHNEYICYECGYSNDRDENAVLNLLALAK